MFFKGGGGGGGEQKIKNKINFGTKQEYLTADSPAIIYTRWLGLETLLL